MIEGHSARRILRMCACLLAIAFPLAARAQQPDPAAPAPAPASREARVLIVATYERKSDSTRFQYEGIVSTLNSRPAGVRTSVHYLVSESGIPDSFSPEYLDALAQVLRARFKGQTFDLVVTIDTLAFEALIGPARDIAGKAPIVFSGLNWSPDRIDALRQAGANTTGIIERLDVPGSFSLMRAAFPKASTVLIVQRGTGFGDRLAAEIRPQLRAARGTMDVRWCTARTPAQLFDEIAALPSDSVVWYLSLDNLIAFVQTHKPPERLWVRPAFGVYESALSLGLTGGRVISGLQEGRAAGAMALRVLAGENARSIPVSRDAALATVMRDPEIARWGIDKAGLPANVRIIDLPTPPRPFSEWAREHWDIVVVVCALQAGLIALLAYNLARRRRAESEATTRGALIELVTDTLPVYISYVDADERYRWVNRRYEEWFRCPREQIIGRRISDLFPPEVYAEAREHIARAMAGERVRFTSHLTSPHGKRQVRDVMFLPRRGPRGENLGFFVLVNDVTAQREAEEEARESVRRFRSVFENAGAGIGLTGPDGRFILVNDRFCSMTGYDRRTLLTKAFRDITHPDDLSENTSLFDDLVAGRADAYSLDKRYLRPDGSEWWASVTVSVERDSGGKPGCFIGVVQDISPRKRAEDALRTSESRLRQAQHVGKLGMLDWNLATNELIVSDETRRIFGLTKEQPTSVDALVGHLHPDERERVVKSLSDAAAGIARHDLEHRVLRPNGDVVHVRAIAELLSEGPDKPVRLLGIVQDITEAKEQEQARRRSEATTRVLLEAIPDMMFRMNRAGEYLDYHAPDPTRLLAPPEKFLGKNVREVLPKDRARECVEALDSLFRTGQPQIYEYEHRRRDGRAAHWECRVVLVGPDEALLLLRDVTQRYNAQSRLRDSEQRLRLMVESTPLAVISWNTDFTVASWNPGAQRLFGWSSQEAIGRHASFIIPEAARSYVEQRWRNLLANKGGLRASNQNLRKDGEIVYCEWYNTPLVDPSGKVLGVASLVEDVTDRRLAQQRQDLMMAELDHRVKNNLAAVISLAEQTGRNAPGYPEFLDTFMGRLRAMARMHSVLAGSRWKGADLRTLVTRTLEAFGTGAAGRVSVQGDDAKLSPRAAQAIAMALNELATNAAKYGALSVQSGSVRVSWEVEPLDAGKRRLRLKWEEHDGPPVSPPTRRGFGSELIEGAIAYELRGTARLGFHPKGVTCDFDLVLPSELESDYPPGLDNAPAAGPLTEPA
ncbi:MAG TPA: ABC transporter substrate binding protein [Phycisphaerales bacterium]|nr:ABC transporter substrate binding protein [Phycisphaerales bacterium]